MERIADYVFEASWEVCNKVGGIYTVVSSKAEQMMSRYSNYYLIGPYFEYHAKTEFNEEKIPEKFQKAFDMLKSQGIICHFGRWDEVKGKPYTILIEFLGISRDKNGIKARLWEDYGIDSLKAGWDFEEPMLWSYTIGKLLHELHNTSLSNVKIVGHFHEWLSAFALLYLKKNCKSIGTVFTTHATMLGRTLCANNVDLYSSIKSLDPISEAYRFGVESKHLTEKAAALNCDIFTTVSEITAIEAEKFFSRKPEVLVYNGLDTEKFPSFEDISIKHRTSRDKIREFLTYNYFPYYTFDLEKNLIFYTVGRFEYHNKGYDLIIKALGRLNNILKNDYDSHQNTSVTMIFWIPMQHYGMKMELLENKNYYMHIKNYISSNGNDILTKLIYNFLSKSHKNSFNNNVSDKVDSKNNSIIYSTSESNNDIGTNTDSEILKLLEEDFIHHLRKDLSVFERNGNPVFSTHNVDENNNPIIQAFKDNGLLNRKEDLVKVIIEPVYLDGNDGFVELNYYDSIIGCHLGLFPSYYEPWGYTPLESVALGVPAITTDLSGFGMFAKNNIRTNDKNTLNTEGIQVLNRLNKNENEVVVDFCNVMHDFIKLSQKDRIDSKISAKNFSTKADWKIFADNYVRAHNMSLSKK